MPSCSFLEGLSADVNIAQPLPGAISGENPLLYIAHGFRSELVSVCAHRFSQKWIDRSIF